MGCLHKVCSFFFYLDGFSMLFLSSILLPSPPDLQNSPLWKIFSRLRERRF